MSKKHFERIAAVVLHTIETAPTHDQATRDGYMEGAMKTARLMAAEFLILNPRFDSERFFAACGMNAVGRALAGEEVAQ